MAGADGELLTPTLSGHQPRDWSADRPWRLGALVYPAILGGPVAATLVAVLNARRLRTDRGPRILVAAAGLVAFAAATAIGAVAEARTARIAVAVLGLATYGVAFAVLRAPDRLHAMFSPREHPDDDYAPVLGPALAAIVAGLALQVLAIVAAGG